MGADDRVGVGDRVSPVDASVGRRDRDLLDTGMGGLQAVQPLLEQGAQAVVCLDGVGEERVAARLGRVEDIQKCRPGGLLLVRHVGVPCHRTDARGKLLVILVVAGTAVHEMDLGVSGR